MAIKSTACGITFFLSTDMVLAHAKHVNRYYDYYTTIYYGYTQPVLSYLVGSAHAV